MRSYPVYVRIDRIPRALIIGGAVFGALFLGKLLGAVLTDAVLVYAEPIIRIID